MAQFNFYLREPNSSKPTPIILRATFSGYKIKCKTNESVPPNKWDTSTKRAKVNKWDTLKQKEVVDKTYKELNARLDSLLVDANDAHKFFTQVIKQIPTQSEYQSKFYELAGFIVPEQNIVPLKITLLQHVHNFIERAKTRGNKRTGLPLAEKSILNFKQVETKLKGFSKKYYPIDFDNIDLKFYDDFTEYLTGLNCHINTIARFVRHFKTMMNDAVIRKHTTDLSFKGFHAAQFETDSVYLNQNELNDIFNLDLSKQPKLDRARDLFLTGCYTGMRYGNYTKLTHKNIDHEGGFIDIVTNKTNDLVSVPIKHELSQILKKYEGKYSHPLPPKISNQKLNEYVKDVCKQVKSLNVPIYLTEIKGNIKVEKEFKKYEKVSTHTARRSFATNLFNEGFPPHLIMKITNHKTESAFLKYIKIAPKDSAKLLKLHWQNSIVKIS